MSRIFTFGCSHTYGHGLRDCVVKDGEHYHPGEHPSKLGWASMIGDHYNRELINLGACGGSNKQIVHTVNLTKFDEGDIALVQWTYPERYCIFRKGAHKSYDNSLIHQMGLWMHEKKSRYYYRAVQSSIDDDIVLGWHTNYVDLLLKKLKCKVIHFRAFAGKDQTQFLDKDVVYANWNLDSFVIDKAVDGNHLGPITNRKFADEIIKAYDHILK